MNTRRSFFKTLAVAAAGFTILPPATTYARVWRATRPDPTVEKFIEFTCERSPQFERDIILIVESCFNKAMARVDPFSSIKPWKFHTELWLSALKS